MCLFAPLMKPLFQRCRHFRHHTGEVIEFALIFLQIEQLYGSIGEALHQFEVPDANGRGGSHAVDVVVLREVEIKRIAIQRILFSIQYGLETQTVEVLFRSQGQTGLAA